MDMADLKRIGLTQGEINLYQALLELGESTRTQLAKNSGISPSKIYDVANRLLEKGIISSVKKNNVIHFAPADPQRLKDYITQKKNELEQERAVVEQLLPSLLLKYKKTKDETDVEVFYGWEGMKTVFDDIVKALGPKEYNYIFGASKGHNSEQADIFFSQYYKKKQEKGFGTKIIFNDNMRTNKKRTQIFKEKPNEIRFLHQDTFAEINTYNNIVLFIMLLKRPIIIRVKNKEAAESFKSYFKSLWSQAKP